VRYKKVVQTVYFTFKHTSTDNTHTKCLLSINLQNIVYSPRRSQNVVIFAINVNSISTHVRSVNPPLRKQTEINWQEKDIFIGLINCNFAKKTFSFFILILHPVTANVVTF